MDYIGRHRDRSAGESGVPPAAAGARFLAARAASCPWHPRSIARFGSSEVLFNRPGDLRRRETRHRSRLADGHAGRREVSRNHLPPFSGCAIVHAGSPPRKYIGCHRADGDHDQLLAALALLAGSIWLSARGIRYGFLFIPMLFMFAVTITALVMLVVKTFSDGNYILAVFAFGLIIVAVRLLVLAFMRFGFKRQPRVEPAAAE